MPEKNMINPAFAAQERTALQQLQQANALLLAQRVPNPARETIPQQLALLKQEKAALVQQIVRKIQQVAGMTQAAASSAARAGEAAEKAAAWSIVGAIIVGVIAVVVAIIVSVFSFGAGIGAMAAALAAASAFAGTAATAPASHPLAGEFSSILKALAAAVNNFSRERERDTRAAITKLFAELDRALARLERLPGPIANLKGCCQGDPKAAFDTGEALRQSLSTYSAILQRVPLEDMDTRPLVSNLSSFQMNLGNALRALVPKR